MSTLDDTASRLPIAVDGFLPSRLRNEGARRTIGWVLHVLVVIGLLIFVAKQYLSEGITGDPDPDGYVTYAKHLDENGRLLKPMRRMPGYPMFLVLCSRQLGTDYHNASYQVQLVLLLLTAAGLHLWLWRRGHVVAGVTFLAVLAAPSFLVTQAAVMLSDFVYAVVVLPMMYYLYCWIIGTGPLRLAVALPAIVAATFILYAIRPTTGVLLLIYLGCLAAAFLVHWWRLRRIQPEGHAALLAFGVRLGAAACVVVVASWTTGRLLDTGSKAFNLFALHSRIAYTVPAATDSPEERVIEDFRENFRESTGQPIEAMLWRLRADTPPPQVVQAIWLGRLKAHSGAYLASVGNALLWTHYLLLRHVVPFAADTSFSFEYPPLDRSPASRVFRYTGFPAAEGYDVAALKFVATWVLFTVGACRLARTMPVLVCALVLCGAGYWVFLAVVVNPEGRYMLPFVLPFYIAIATGIETLVTFLIHIWARGHAKPMTTP